VSLLLRQKLSGIDRVPTDVATAYVVPALTSPEAVLSWLHPALDYLQSSRPTAVNLGEAMQRIRNAAKDYKPSGSDTEAATKLAGKIVETCQAVHANDLERNKEMSRLGAEWLWERRKGGESQKKLRVMTVRSFLVRPVGVGR
jgi:methylthioribose-1-phosphate isomerase